MRTPLSNSIAEMFTIQRYLQYDLLKDMDLTHFDAWCSTFCEPQTSIELSPDGSKYRGLSHNQICIGVATDKENIICVVEGTGKPSQRKTVDAFSARIATGSTLVHDKESAHKELVSLLGLTSQSYSSKDIKGLKDSENPMNPINRVHDSLKKFLNAHSGFNRDSLQGYLNLFAFVRNPPHEPLEKVATIVNLAFENPKSLRYREQFGLNTEF